jgi:DNA-binding phage protein
MTREILYKKPSEQKKNLSDFKIVSERKNTSLIEWIKVHKLINISGLCKEAGINRSNFDKSLKMGAISPKHENVLSNILKKYGYEN